MLGGATIHNPLVSPDTIAMARGIEAFGASVDMRPGNWIVEKGFRQPNRPIVAGNSGQVFRFLTALGGHFETPVEITGDASIQSRRPIAPLIQALNELGRPLRPGNCSLEGQDSQLVSSLLIACSLLEGPTNITVENPGETPWIDLTLHWLKKMNARVDHKDYTSYTVQGGMKVEPFTYTVPGDYSTAAFPLAASMITGLPVNLLGLDPHDVQGDKQLIDLLLSVESPFEGFHIDINPIIDALPILTVLACFATSPSHLHNGAIARHKESDRISAIATELRKMGAQIEELPDGLKIQPAPLYGATVHSHNDHRIAMALSVAALGAHGPSVVQESECIAKTYPNFQEDIGHFKRDLVWT